MKTFLKALAVVVCAGLLIWNAAQLKAIEKGTHEVTVEYGDYVADDAIGEYREAKILGLIPFAVEENQQKYGSQIMSTKVVAYYCLAVLEDYSMGAVKLTAVNEELVGYDEWIIETEEDYVKVMLSEGFTIRGETMAMPHFDADTIGAIMNGSYDFDTMWQEEKEFNESLDGITLLNTAGYYPDTKTVIPDLSTLNGNEGFVIVVLVVAALMLAWDLLKIFAEKSVEKKAREAKAQPQQTAVNSGAAGNQAADLVKEYTRVLMECSSAPVGDPTQAAEYALSKVQYFRSKGMPENDLYHLEISICTNIPTYVLQNYNKVFAAFNQDATPFWAATENLAKQGKLKEAYALSKPLVDHIDKNRSTMVAGKHSFQNIVEDCLYRHVNGFTLKTPVDLTRGNYVGLLVSHAKLIQKLSAVQADMKGTEKKYLELAQTLSNVNSSAYLYMAQCVDQDEQLWKENIDKALRFCYEQDGMYGLCQIYFHMGLHYMSRQNDKLSAACFTLAIRYGDKETAGISQFLLSKTEAGGPMDTKDAVAILNENQIQIGYSQSVREVAETLSAHSNVKPMIQHILDDHTEAYLLQ